MITISGIEKAMAEARRELSLQTAYKKKQIMKDLVQSLKDATPVDTGEARDGWRIEGSSIENDVGHVSELNQGSSQQAPTHFIESTVLSHRGVRPNGVIVKET